MRITFLGTGSSSGTPAIDRGWGNCDPAEPKNRRLRSSIIVESATTRLLVDTSPDLREQLLAAQVTAVDAVLFTHGHADHLHGIDDLRPINRLMERPIDAYTDAETLAVIGQRFGYVFEPLAPGETFYYKPTLVPHEIADGDTFRVGDIDITSFRQDHGYSETLGFRFGDVAYSTDVVEFPEAAAGLLGGLDLWIIGTFTDKPRHPTHVDVERAIEWVARAGAKRAVFTHFGVGVDHAAICRTLPSHINAAYDGLCLEAGVP